MEDSPSGRLKERVPLHLTLKLVAFGVLAPTIDLSPNPLLGPRNVEHEAQRVEVELGGGQRTSIDEIGEAHLKDAVRDALTE